MNKHILMCEKWLDDNDSVSQSKLTENFKSTSTAAAYVFLATYAAYQGDTVICLKYLLRFYNRPGENRQDYLDEVKKQKAVSGGFMSDDKAKETIEKSMNSLKIEVQSDSRNQQDKILMEESLKCIIDHLSDVGISGANQNFNSEYHVPLIGDLSSVEQKVKWIALNALDMLNIDTRTDEEKLINEVAEYFQNIELGETGIHHPSSVFHDQAKSLIASDKFNITLK